MTFFQRIFGYRSKLSAACLAIWLTGCTSLPRPAPNISITYSVARPDVAAKVHADAIYGMNLVLAGGSMEPFLRDGDYLVADFTKLFPDTVPGGLLVYDPNWADASVPLVCHMAVEPTGECWIMTGLANRYSESGANALCQPEYRATVVAIYTSRKKPLLGR